MARIPEIVPVSDLRREAAAVLKKIRDSNDPVVVTQRGRAAAVILSVEEYERKERDLEILRLLARGEKEIACGQGVDLEDVMSEAAALLADADE
jgi:prevent-host-death family protein